MLKPARVLNIASDMMLEEVDTTDKRRQLLEQITGPFRTMGTFVADPETMNAPSWWRGEDEAYESTMASVGQVARRGHVRR